MDKRESNYEIMKHQMQTQFAAYDMDAVCREWQLERKDGAPQLTLLDRRYWIDQQSGAVLWEKDGTVLEADYNVSMTVFDILTRSRQTASGEMTSINGLSTVHTATAPTGSFFDRTARRFSNRCEQLSAACERLGGVHYGKGDVAYILPVFRDLQIAIQFWDCDDEFPPELSFLCDKNILRFMHFETMMFLLCHVADRITEFCDEMEREGQNEH